MPSQENQNSLTMSNAFDLITTDIDGFNIIDSNLQIAMPTKTDSLQKLAKSLKIEGTEETTLLRNTCREWLENACHNDDRIMAGLSKKYAEVRKQAKRFVMNDGVRFFEKAVKERVIKGLHDRKLIDTVVKMMLIQCQNKERKLRERKEKQKARFEARSDTDSDEMQDSCESRNSVAPEDTECKQCVVFDLLILTYHRFTKHHNTGYTTPLQTTSHPCERPTRHATDTINRSRFGR